MKKQLVFMPWLLIPGLLQLLEIQVLADMIHEIRSRCLGLSG